MCGEYNLLLTFSIVQPPLLHAKVNISVFFYEVGGMTSLCEIKRYTFRVRRSNADTRLVNRFESTKVTSLMSRLTCPPHQSATTL